MNDLTVFEHMGQEVRTVVIDGSPWFVVSDVCDYFNVTNRNRVLQHVDPEDKGGTRMATPGGEQTIAIVNESGLYAILFALRPGNARGVSAEEIERRNERLAQFKRWVTHEVLPAIRKTGGYSATRELTLEEQTLQVITGLQSRVEEQQLELEHARPRAHAWDAFISSKGDFGVAEAAKVLSRDHGIKTGERRLFAWMEQAGWIFRNGHGSYEAYQSRVEQGHLRMKTSSRRHPVTGEEIANPATVRIAARGLDLIVRRMTEQAERPQLAAVSA